jgi:hypothetical protein
MGTKHISDVQLTMSIVDRPSILHTAAVCESLISSLYALGVFDTNDECVDQI